MWIRERGVGMIEVMVALLLLSIGIVGLAALQSKSTRWSVDAEDRTRAALLADELAALMLISRTVRLPHEEVERMKIRVADSASGGLPGGTFEIRENQHGAEILMTWNARSGKVPAQHRLSTQVVLSTAQLAGTPE